MTQRIIKNKINILKKKVVGGVKVETSMELMRREFTDNVVPFKKAPLRRMSDEDYFEMKEMMFLLCEVLVILLPREQIGDFREGGPSGARSRSHFKNWLKRSFFFRDSGLCKAFKSFGIKNYDAMVDIVLYEFHAWLNENY